MGWMTNLGNFAGGAAKGILSQQELQQRQQELSANRDMKERTLKIAEANEADRAAKAKDDAEARAEFQQVHQKWWGPQQVQDGVGPDGQPVMKTMQYQPGQDTTRDFGYMTDMVAAQAKRTQDPQHLAKAFDYIEKNRGNQVVADVLSSANGNSEATQRLVSMAKGDPTKSKGIDMKTWSLDLGNGKSIPMKDFAMLGGYGKLYEMFREKDKDARDDKKTDASIDSLRAQAGEHNATAGLRQAQAKNVGQATGDKMLEKHISMTLANDPMGKKDADMATYIMGSASTKEDVPVLATRYRDSAVEADAILANKNDFAAAAKKFGTTDRKQLRRTLIQAGVGRYQQEK